MEKLKHNEIIKAQFSKQAVGYTSVKAHAEALNTLIEMSSVSSKDNVLDVACGSGIVSCAFAKYARHVTGVDITAEMLEQARKLQTQNNLTNLEWVLGDADPLKFNSNKFSIVLSRFSFHHFLEYEKVFEEMIRVCIPGGIVMVVDVALPNEKRKAFDEMELLRDPSHTGVLSPDMFKNLFQHPFLTNSRASHYQMNIALETQLNASFMTDESQEKFRALIFKDVNRNDLGVNVTQINNSYQLYYPVHIYLATKR
jgi:ubiquinone/menaquinone biosynthesis C-methylase UbiE